MVPQPARHPEQRQLRLRISRPFSNRYIQRRSLARRTLSEHLNTELGTSATTSTSVGELVCCVNVNTDSQRHGVWL